jgi:hypothetical protein
MGGNALAMVGGTRLGPVTRQLDSPAPEQSLRVQCGGQQFGNEVDGPGMRPRPSGDIGERQVCGAPPCPSHDRPNRSSLRRHRGARPGVPSIKHHHRPVRQWQAIYSFDARFRNSREARRRLAARRRLRTSTQLPQPASPLVKADRVGARSCACTPCPATSSGSGRPSSRAAAVRASEGAIWMP